MSEPTTKQQPTFDFSTVLSKPLSNGEQLDFAKHGAELLSPIESFPLPNPVVLSEYEWPETIQKLGVYYAQARLANNVVFPLVVRPDLLEHAHAIVQQYAPGSQQLPSVIFSKTKSEFYYNARGNGYGRIFLSPLNEEGVNVVIFPHTNDSKWMDACRTFADNCFHVKPDMAIHLKKQPHHTVHVARGQILALDLSMPFGFDKSTATDYQVHCVMYEEQPKAHQRRHATWTDLLQAKGWFKVCEKFQMPQMSAKQIATTKKEEIEQNILPSIKRVAEASAVPWLTSKEEGKVAKKAQLSPSPSENSSFHERAAKLLPGSLRLTTSKLLESKTTFNAKETEKLKEQLSKAETGQVALATATQQMADLTAQVNNLVAPADMTKVNTMITTLKRDFAALHELIDKACLLEKTKAVAEMHAKMEKIKQEAAKGLIGKKRGGGGTAASSSVLEGAALQTFVEQINKSLNTAPNAALQAVFDVMMSKIAQLIEKELPLSYDVSAVQKVLNAKQGVAGASASKKQKSGGGAAASGATAKCHRKSGGCGKTVASLYQDQPVCLSCFKVYLKDKSQRVFKKLDEAHPLHEALADEYELVYPENANASTKSVDPSKLYELVKQISGAETVVPMEIDLNSNSGNADEDDEEDGDDLDLEDDSMVVPDDEVSFASSASDEEEEEDDEEEEFETTRNKHGKRERTEKVSVPLHVVAHRILNARERTPIESRLVELYDLHRKAAAAAQGEAADKLIAAAEVRLEELESLKSVFQIHAKLGDKSMTHPFCFFSEAEAEACLALLEKNRPGLKGRVEEKILGA